jgi:hypothetical protein
MRRKTVKMLTAGGARVTLMLGAAFALLTGAAVAPAQGTGGSLLAPTGAWGVGRTTVELTDSSRAMPDSSRPRRLVVHLWYPTQREAGGRATNAFLYSNILEELATHGYIVAAVDHPGAALFVAYADGVTVPYSETGRPTPGDPGYAAALRQYLQRN